MNSIFKEDLLEIANSNYIDWDKLNNKKILITGATRLNRFNFSKNDNFKK